MIGLHQLSQALSHTAALPINHVRSLNPHVESALSASQLGTGRQHAAMPLGADTIVRGGVSGFAFQGKSICKLSQGRTQFVEAIHTHHCCFASLDSCLCLSLSVRCAGTNAHVLLGASTTLHPAATEVPTPAPEMVWKHERCWATAPVSLFCHRFVLPSVIPSPQLVLETALASPQLAVLAQLQLQGKQTRLLVPNAALNAAAAAALRAAASSLLVDTSACVAVRDGAFSGPLPLSRSAWLRSSLQCVVDADTGAVTVSLTGSRDSKVRTQLRASAAWLSPASSAAPGQQPAAVCATPARRALQSIVRQALQPAAAAAASYSQISKPAQDMEADMVGCCMAEAGLQLQLLQGEGWLSGFECLVIPATPPNSHVSTNRGNVTIHNGAGQQGVTTGGATGAAGAGRSVQGTVASTANLQLSNARFRSLADVLGRLSSGSGFDGDSSDGDSAQTCHGASSDSEHTDSEQGTAAQGLPSLSYTVEYQASSVAAGAAGLPAVPSRRGVRCRGSGGLQAALTCLHSSAPANLAAQAVIPAGSAQTAGVQAMLRCLAQETPAAVASACTTATTACSARIGLQLALTCEQLGPRAAGSLAAHESGASLLEPVMLPSAGTAASDPYSACSLHRAGRYVVTGGSGALAGHLVCWLITTAKVAEVVVVSRSGALPECVLQLLATNTQAETRITAAKCDTAAAADLIWLLQHAAGTDSSLPLLGVFHAAGSLADGLVRNTTW